MDLRTGLPVVGMVGGGPLARMTHQAAIALGQSLRVLALAVDDGAALVAADVHIGRHDDPAALGEFVKGCDVVTFDHEHVPGQLIRALAAEGVTLLPGADALRYAQNTRDMRERLGELGFPVSPWSAGDVQRRRELATVVARSPFGQVATYPVVETALRDGTRVEVLAPAPDLDAATAVEAQRLAIDIAVALDVVGVLAVELLDTAGGLLVNELAMRPHHSAHWTIEGARTSQFEQHLRAVLDYPLGDTRLTAPVVAMANVLGGEPGGRSIDERLHHLFAADPAVKVHFYGKQVRPGRKIGHV